ncbi:MAG TPA: Zn-ribbon domain-containing OB-fold protein [Candidatus Binatia bacterium]|nr:Zn-ribbon domain-containing OB-fold protein [Candidatus Binatia bacterium]
MKSQPNLVRGTPLDEKELRQGKAFSVAYAPKLRYAWDKGQAISRYLAELKEGRLIARACRKCERIMVPPRMFCERCFRPTDEWVYVKDTGKILTFSLCYVSWDVRRLKQPQIPAVIAIDGASPGMGILHVVKKVTPNRVRVGMAVKAVWNPKRERKGSVTDIAYWQPIKSER